MSSFHSSNEYIFKKNSYFLLFYAILRLMLYNIIIVFKVNSKIQIQPDSFITVFLVIMNFQCCLFVIIFVVIVTYKLLTKFCSLSQTSCCSTSYLLRNSRNQQGQTRVQSPVILTQLLYQVKIKPLAPFLFLRLSLPDQLLDSLVFVCNVPLADGCCLLLGSGTEENSANQDGHTTCFLTVDFGNFS